MLVLERRSVTSERWSGSVALDHREVTRRERVVFNKTFLSDIDEDFVRANDEADRAAGGRPIAYPSLQH